MVAGRADQALTLIERALSEAASLKAVALLPYAHRVEAAALLAKGDIARARAAAAAGLRQSSSPDVAHERVLLLATSARIAYEELDAAPPRERGVGSPSVLGGRARTSNRLRRLASRMAQTQVVVEEHVGVQVAVLPLALRVVDEAVRPECAFDGHGSANVFSAPSLIRV